MRHAILLAVVLSGCSLLGGDAAEVGFVVTEPEAAPTSVRASATLDGRPVALTRLPDTGGRTTFAEPIVTDARATPVSCRLVSDAAASELTRTLDLEPDWRYIVRCEVGATDPADLCFGCRGSDSVPLDPAFGLAADERLWLVWSGDPKDAVIFY